MGVLLRECGCLRQGNDGDVKGSRKRRKREERGRTSMRVGWQGRPCWGGSGESETGGTRRFCDYLREEDVMRTGSSEAEDVGREGSKRVSPRAEDGHDTTEQTL